MTKDTKRVAGENLTKDAFAYVGDPQKKSTWKLPIKFSSEAKTKRHIRNAIARFGQTDMPNEAAKAEAWKRIKAAAKEYGIEVSDDSKKACEAELTREAAVRAERLGRGLAAEPESEDPALAYDSDAQRDADMEEQREELTALPMLTRDLEIAEMIPVYERDAADGDGDDDDLGADEPLDDSDKERGDSEELAEEGQGGQGKSDKKSKKKNGSSKKETDTYDITLSSEAPVDRWFGREILEHSPEAVDMSRAKLGLPFLDSHDPTRIIGIIQGARIDNKKLRGRARFSRNAAAQMVKRDMLDGIRKFTSIGYAVQKMVLAESSKETGDVYRAVRWTPMEASSVAIPADTSVGFGRAQEHERTYPVEVVREQLAPNAEKQTVTIKLDAVDLIRAMKEETATLEKLNENRSTPAPQAAPTPTAPAAPAEVRHHMDPKTAAEIIRLGKLHNIEQETVAKWVEEDRSVDQVSKEILGLIQKGAKALSQPAAEERIELSATEQSQYRISRLILAAAAREEGRREENCLELEVSETIRKQFVAAGRTLKGSGIFFPTSLRHQLTPAIADKFPKLKKVMTQRAEMEMQKRAGLFTGGATAGETLVFTEPGEFIRFLYNVPKVIRLGARTVSGLRDNVSFPRQTARGTGSWVTENPGVDVADTTLALGSIPSSPKTYQSSSSYSRQLLAQGTIDVDTLVREDLIMDIGLALDSAAVQGGGSNQPKGILSTTGVQSFVDAADAGNGGAMAWNDYIGMEKVLEEVNADQLGEPAWLTTPQVKATAKTTARLSNTIGLPIWADDNTIDGLDSTWTNQVPSNLVKGTSGATLSALILGVFNTMVIAQWGSGMEMIVDPYRLKKQGMIEVTTFCLHDVVLRYPVGFVANQAVIAA